MTLAEHPAPTGPTGLAGKAADHLWMHFTRMGRAAQHPVPIITRGEGVYIYDDQGRRILDGLSGCSWSRLDTGGASWPR